jgi:hypothetical protein
MAPAFGTASLQEHDPCPKCKEGYLERVKHRFGEGSMASLPDCSWLLCLDCGYETEPE